VGSRDESRTRPGRLPSSSTGVVVLLKSSSLARSRRRDDAMANATATSGKTWEKTSDERSSTTSTSTTTSTSSSALATLFARANARANDGHKATREDVTRAFRALLLQCHPDRGGTREAYDALVRTRDDAYDEVDRATLMNDASTYDWRASRKTKARDDGARAREEARTRTRTPTKAETTRTTTATTTTIGAPTMRTFEHASCVTAMATYRSVVAVGEMSGRVSVWHVDDGDNIFAFDAPSEGNDAVSIVDFGRHGRLAVTYVTTKPHFLRVDEGKKMASKPRLMNDAHDKRITSASWFAGGDDDGNDDAISNAFVTAALDGTVIVRSFTSETSSRLGWAKTHAVIALGTLATTATSGFLTVADVRGNFQLWRVEMCGETLSDVRATAFSNVVAWDGFGGISRVFMSLASDRHLRVLTVFNDVNKRESRALEWNASIAGDAVDIKGFQGAFPSAKTTFRGLVTDIQCVPTSRSDDDDDDDDDADEDEDESLASSSSSSYVVLVDDVVYVIDAETKSTTYALDLVTSGSFVHRLSASAFAISRVVGHSLVVDAFDADDGAAFPSPVVLPLAAFASRDAVASSSSSSSSSTAAVRVLAPSRVSLHHPRDVVVVAARRVVVVVRVLARPSSRARFHSFTRDATGSNA